MDTTPSFSFPTPLIIQGKTVRLAVAYLGTEVAEVWIGPHPVGPTDDDDARVLRDRAEAERAWREGKTKRPSGISAFQIRDEDDDGYYELDISQWPPGEYRFMYHAPKFVQATFGTAVDIEKRDLEFSWAQFPKEAVLAVRSFIYWDPNGRGFGFRIRMTEDGSVQPAGNGHEAASFNQAQREAMRRHGF